MANKTIILENSIDEVNISEAFVWQQLRALEKGFVLKLRYNSKVIELLRVKLIAYFESYAKIEIKILDGKMRIKGIKLDRRATWER